MESVDLTPRYSDNEVPGRCIKCLAEEKLFNCMRELFKEDKENPELEKKYELLYSFLGSADLQKICDESERFLSEGKEVSVRITLDSGKPRFEIKLKS